MRTKVAIAAGLVSGSLFLIAPQPARASVSVGVNIGLFHDSLSPYGNWTRSARFGMVWTPRGVSPSWRPYLYGHWAYTDYDWTWVSDEEWGWATYHYGRWYFDPAVGWVWVPGDEWGPAWVTWRADDDYVGWAPLPPDVDVFRVGIGYSVDPFAFSFVRLGRICEPHVFRHVIPVSRNLVFVRGTRNVTRYSREGRRVLNRGIDVRHVERITRRAVPRTRARDIRSPGQARGPRARGGEAASSRAPLRGRRDPAAGAHVSDRNGSRPVARPQQRERRESRPFADQGRARRRSDLQTRVPGAERRTAPVVRTQPRREQRVDSGRDARRSSRGTVRSGDRPRPQETRERSRGGSSGQRTVRSPQASRAHAAHGRHDRH